MNLMTDFPTLPVPDLPDAACADMDAEAWFPETGEDGDDAKRVCAFCPAKQPCLQWALDTRQQFGIYGGLTAAQRRGLTYPKNRRSRLLNPSTGPRRTVQAGTR